MEWGLPLFPDQMCLIISSPKSILATSRGAVGVGPVVSFPIHSTDFPEPSLCARVTRGYKDEPQINLLLRSSWLGKGDRHENKCVQQCVGGSERSLFRSWGRWTWKNAQTHGGMEVRAQRNFSEVGSLGLSIERWVGMGKGWRGHSRHEQWEPKQKGTAQLEEFWGLQMPRVGRLHSGGVMC